MSTPAYFLQASGLPTYCAPENEFLYRFSSAFNTCVPTNLAFVSCLLGTCSIISWLFAQLPQIFKNYKLKSTSGLSIIFLAEWLLGDATNLVGSLFTGQALWQVVIASYYCFVDCCLVGQWIWYEHLKHGRPLKKIWGRWKNNSDDNSDALSIASVTDRSEGSVNSRASSPKPISRPKPMSGNNMFHTPKFSPRSPSVMDTSSSHSTPAANRHISRPANSTSPMPSPRTVLYISLLLAVVARASPVGESVTSSDDAGEAMTITAIIGKACSWSSTFLYLGSRIPQLYKNYVRKSTAGLSLTLFAAAFCGNFFYSASMLTNPCLWYTFPKAHSKEDSPSRGWVGPEGSDRGDWTVRALPFFLGAAGVLIMDAAVAVQFYLYEDHQTKTREEVTVIVVADPENQPQKNGQDSSLKWRWRRVSGYMRGWVPSVGAVGMMTRAREDERRSLLQAEQAESGGYGATRSR